jgi:2-iminobutanoate/2-iminopropanoate deaminase
VSKRAVQTNDAPPPGGAYSQAIAAGDLVFLAGQGPFTPAGDKIDEPFGDAARQAFANLAAVAAAAGGSLADAVRVGVYLRSMDDFPEMNEVYREFFPEPLPARTTIQTDLPGFSIDVDAILSLSG